MDYYHFFGSVWHCVLLLFFRLNRSWGMISTLCGKHESEHLNKWFLGLIFLFWGRDLFPYFSITCFYNIKGHVRGTVSRGIDNNGSEILEKKKILTLHVRCEESCLDKSQGEYKTKLFKHLSNLFKFHLIGDKKTLKYFPLRLHRHWIKRIVSLSGFVFSKLLIFRWSNQHLWPCWNLLWWGTEVCWQECLAIAFSLQTLRTWRSLNWES